MKTIRTIFLILALAVIFSAFCACAEKALPDDGESEANTDTNGQENNSYDEETTPPTPVITDTFYPQYAYNGQYDSEKSTVKEWFMQMLEDGTLFSSKIGEDEFPAIFARAEKSTATEKVGDDDRIIYTLNDRQSGILYTLDATLYADYPTLDYVVWAENTGDGVSEVISSFNGIDSSFPMPANKGYALHTTVGSLAHENDFEPVEAAIGKGTSYTYFPNLGDGRSTSGGWPYFDIIGKNCGVILAVGWTGIWEASFGNETVGYVDIKASQKTLATALAPNEKIRSPRIVLTFFNGGEEYGHNVFRKLIIEHYTPNDGSEDRFVSPSAINAWGGTTEEFFMKALPAFYNNGIVPELLWLDAGWNADHDLNPSSTNHAANNSVWAEKLGWYTVNKKLFPDGTMKKVSDYVHEHGVKYMLWWMIEDGTLAYEDQMTLGKENFYGYADGSYKNKNRLMLNLADDAVFDKLLAYVRNMFDTNGIDCFRVDNGDNPIYYWQLNDEYLKSQCGYERVGISENKHILNYYRLWDTLASEYDGFILDNCASGGRRLDIEMTKRGIPLWRTDYDCDSNDLAPRQAQTQWISYWLPLSASGVTPPSPLPYIYRSNLSSSWCYGIDRIDDLSINNFKIIDKEFRHFRPYWYGSYYNIITPDLSSESWNAYELFREDWQKGMMVIIRRDCSSIETVKLKFKGLCEDISYVLHDYDEEGTENDLVKTGKELMEKGLNFTLLKGTIKIYEISPAAE